MGCSNDKYATNLKEILCMLQSRTAVSEQGTDVPLTEKIPDFASMLLGLNKGMYLVDSSGGRWSVQLQSL
jgi:hypothetical protein